MNKSYIPGAGDIVLVHVEPRAPGVAPRPKPALVLSPSAYNKKTGLMVCCPVTTHIKGYPFEVLIDTTPDQAVLADQIKTLDWANGRISREARINSAELAEVRAKLHALILKN